MVGLELGDAAQGEPDSARIGRVIAHCRDEGRLLLMNAGTYGNVVRFMPPLVVTEAEIDRGSTRSAPPSPPRLPPAPDPTRTAADRPN